MSLAHGNNTPTQPRIEPGSPDPESNALTTRPVRLPTGEHVWIEAENNFVFIYDRGCNSGAKRRSILLKPQERYKDADRLMFRDIE